MTNHSAFFATTYFANVIGFYQISLAEAYFARFSDVMAGLALLEMLF